MSGATVARRIATCSAVLLAALPAAGRAQTLGLQLKTEPPSAETVVCAPDTRSGAPAPPDSAARATARRLTTRATQSLILGDFGQAGQFLERALQEDPGAAEVLYLQGRVADQTGNPEEALDRYCAYLGRAPSGPSAPSARAQLEAAAAAGAGRDLYALFDEGVARFDADELDAADARFAALVANRPAVAEAVYNRAVIALATGEADTARAYLERYIQLAPTAPDHIAVEEALVSLWAEPTALAGTRTAARPAARPAAALFLGAVFPGGGQYYTRRPLLGAAFTSLAAGALGAGYLYEKTTVRCRAPAPDGSCPPAAVADRTTERPYFPAGLAVAGGIAILAALEAALHADGESPAGAAGAAVERTADALSRIRVVPGPTRRAPVVQLSLIRGRF